MTTQALAMPQLDAALDKESYDWLAELRPDILEAVESEVARGSTPERIKLRVIMRVGRLELALRCEAAARHIKAREAGR